MGRVNYPERLDSRAESARVKKAAKKRTRGCRAGRRVQAQKRKRERQLAQNIADLATEGNTAATLALISTSGRWTQSPAAVKATEREFKTETAPIDSLPSPCYSPSPEFEFKYEPPSVETLSLCISEIKAEIASPPPDIESIDLENSRKVFNHREIPDELLLKYAREKIDDPYVIPTSIWEWCEFRFNYQ
ncbi:uncharacterized protein LOC114881995 isoform X2 [Osmia bicornis bicornis]|uniref:uncharacterized protein LOC114881995 isoform X2 n=1 Tax=Osmia bicornis bicornis TaxID=1437191 RepID=UPI001EAE8CE6|nr:uncharacterized protein LOC114881995 isoform X2 [Osmia bicornis bicornis]